jgi:C4-dicarboxylate-specific signal transduction histidine kinase
MKLRLIILVLALLSFLSTAVGGYLYYSSLRNSALEESFYKADELVKDMADHIDFYLAEHKRSIETLAGLKEIQEAMVSRDSESMAKANEILDHFKDTLELSVCYMMDAEGNTIASSNRNTPGSFMGKNYSFRPYFREAMKGKASVYMALGVTSKKRGAYFGYPIYGKGRDVPAGVVVIKAFIDDMEKEIARRYEGMVVLADPDGVVFIANHTDWMYHVLWQLSSESISKIAESRQFGKGPWLWTGMERKNTEHAVDKSGKEYHIHETGIQNYPGWNIIYLHDHDIVLEKIAVPIFKTAGYIILTLCVLIGISVALLYWKASFDILKRRQAEEALKKHLEMEKEFNRELEPLVAERTMSLLALTVADRLRNPATVIGLICKRLLKKLESKEDIKEGLGDIVNETESLNKIVQNYEDLLESRKSMFVYGNINTVVSEAVTLVENDARARGVKLVVKLPDELLNINLRKNLLRIAIFHILSNAIHETQEGGSITVSTSGSDYKVFLVISDTGAGFKKESLEKVFDPFFSTKEQSYGLGLPLVKQIVTEHLGEIEVESEEGRGTTFRLTFPVRWVK